MYASFLSCMHNLCVCFFSCIQKSICMLLFYHVYTIDVYASFLSCIHNPCVRFFFIMYTQSMYMLLFQGNKSFLFLTVFQDFWCLVLNHSSFGYIYWFPRLCFEKISKRSNMNRKINIKLT